MNRFTYPLRCKVGTLSSTLGMECINYKDGLEGVVI